MEVNVTNFKAKCIQYVDAVQNRGDVVVITRHGKAAAKLVPMEDGEESKLFGRGMGPVKEKGALYSTGESWDAES